MDQILIEDGPTHIKLEILSFGHSKNIYKETKEKYKCFWIYTLIQEN